MARSLILALIAIFLFGLTLRIASIYPANTIIGFDQARDLFDARKIILDRDLRIVGPTAGNNANLHHGVLFLYFILPPILIGGGNPFWVAVWNSLFNAASALVLFFFARSLFKNTWTGIIAAFIAAVSYYFIEFSGWLSNPTLTLLTVPIFFYGLWRYKEGKKWALPLSMFFLGLSIELELFFIYLIPITLILFLVLKMKLPDLKTSLASLTGFALATATMILTEIKFGFSGVKAILLAGDGAKTSTNDLLANFLERFWATFSLNLWPQLPPAGVILGTTVISFLVYKLIKAKTSQERSPIVFLVVYLLSPVTMLVLGTHAAPWFLIGLPPAIALAAGYTLSQIRFRWLGAITILLIAFANISAVRATFGSGQVLLEPDKSAILSTQLAAIDYTYEKSAGRPFGINTVTNPLYVNAVWAWNYDWYGKKYGYLPAWLGGTQLHPYGTLPDSTGGEAFIYLIIDESGRIPPVYKDHAVAWAKNQGKFVEEKEFPGLLVQKYSKILKK